MVLGNEQSSFLVTEKDTDFIVGFLNRILSCYNGSGTEKIYGRYRKSFFLYDSGSAFFRFPDETVLYLPVSFYLSIIDEEANQIIEIAEEADLSKELRKANDDAYMPSLQLSWEGEKESYRLVINRECAHFLINEKRII